MKGWISAVDLEIWLREKNAATSYTRYERAFRRMDLNRDGRIDFDEFLLMVRPIYNYSSYDLRYSSPAKIALRESITNRKEFEISKKMEEIKELRLEISSSRIEDETEGMHIYSTPQRDANLRTAHIRKSLYNTKYESPARKLAQEVREEILSRSLDRARIRALQRSPHRYQSPVKSTLSSTRLKFELEESRRWWRDRYVHHSPARHSRYYSPSRTG